MNHHTVIPEERQAGSQGGSTKKQGVPDTLFCLAINRIGRKKSGRL
jgi:hypothetical protein